VVWCGVDVGFAPLHCSDLHPSISAPQDKSLRDDGHGWRRRARYSQIQDNRVAHRSQAGAWHTIACGRRARRPQQSPDCVCSCVWRENAFVWEGKVTFKATAAVCLIHEAMKVRTELDFDGPLPLLWGAPRPFRFSHPPTTQVAVLCKRMPCTQWSDFETDRVPYIFD
jgi:hypothetical protein